MIIASIFAPPEAYQFQGYCFVNEHLIIGASGADEYQAVTGELPSPGLDGCYVTAFPTDNGWVFGTDSRGLAKLFVYQRGDIWAIGSSLFSLVQHLRENGVYPAPKIGQILVAGVAGSFTDQPASSDMPFQDIELIPTFCTVIVNSEGSIKTTALPESVSSSYEESLTHYLSMWASRLETILQHPGGRIAADLSGGIDSRAVFAFLSASRSFNTDCEERFRLVSNTRMNEDFTAASRIAQNYHLKLNGPTLRSRVRQQPHTALEHWRAHSLGVYLPVYLNNAGFDPLTVQAHGAGGGANRQTLPDESIAAKLAKYKTKMRREDFTEWATAVSTSLVRLSKLRPNIDPLILHYREFRNRFHFGHRPLQKVMFTPLNSILVDGLTQRTGVSSRQHFYDIMESLSPGLSDFAYDNPNKAPTADEKSNITRVPFKVSKNGRIYGEDHQTLQSNEQGGDAYKTWLSECESILTDDELQEALGEDRLALCYATLEKDPQSSRRLRANHEGIVALSLAYTVGFALDTPFSTLR